MEPLEQEVAIELDRPDRTPEWSSAPCASALQEQTVLHKWPDAPEHSSPVEVLSSK
jgi:hypothetical protein